MSDTAVETSDATRAAELDRWIKLHFGTPSHYTAEPEIADAFARVRAEERERCARKVEVEANALVADSREHDTGTQGVAFSIRVFMRYVAAAVRRPTD